MGGAEWPIWGNDQVGVGGQYEGNAGKILYAQLSGGVYTKTDRVIITGSFGLWLLYMLDPTIKFVDLLNP